MNDTDDIKEHPDISITGIVLSILSIIICFFLLFIICKSKVFQTYSFYYIIIFNIIFAFDNIVRISPFDDKQKDEYNIKEKIQAFCLIFFNKFELSIITMQNLIYYLGIIKANNYSSNKKLIFFLTLLINSISSLALSLIIFKKAELEAFRVYCYIKNTEVTKIIDLVFHCTFYLINFFCLLSLICYLCRKKSQADSGFIEDMDYKHHLYKMIVLELLVTSLFFLSIYFNLKDLRTESYYDLFFLINAFILDLVYCVNRVLIKEILKVFCKQTYKEKYKKIKNLKIFGDNTTHNDDEDEEETNRKRRGTNFK